MFNPSATVTSSYKYLKFLGLLLGVAMRTRKPLDLHLAQPMWKLLAGMSLTPVDLEEVGLAEFTNDDDDDGACENKNPPPPPSYCII